MLNPVFIEATTIPDAWFQALWSLMDNGRRYTIERGSYEGQERLELDYITIHIKFPSARPILPQIPSHIGIPDPVAPDYLDDYMPYLMTSEQAPGEDYTYGQFLEPQIEEVIRMFKEDGHQTNQAYMTVGEPKCIYMKDPPCLRGLDCRISYGALNFMVYFRSNDLWGGFPANLASIQLLKEYMAGEIGVKDGEIIYSSKGLHLYDYAEPLAKMRCLR